MDDLDYKLYVLAELSYKKEHPDIEEDELYPQDWYSFNNYKLKNEIIAEAIRNKQLIQETPKYQELINHIRSSH
jgi:hypothetical protein